MSRSAKESTVPGCTGNVPRLERQQVERGRCTLIAVGALWLAATVLVMLGNLGGLIPGAGVIVLAVVRLVQRRPAVEVVPVTVGRGSLT